MKILIINGPNLNLLGSRDKDHYGSFTLNELESKLRQEFVNVEFTLIQSSYEGEIIESIHGARNVYDGLIINPGGFSHTSVAIRDALEALTGIPKIEVHLSNIAARENFRQTLITAAVCDGYISGFKELSYISGIYLILKLLESR